MDSWSKALRQGMWPGALASLASTLALAACGKRETGSVFAGVNAVSHWIWGKPATRADAPSLKHTLVGYLIHHGAAVFWAALFEKTCRKTLDKKDLAGTATAAAAATAVACFTDYQLTPQRLQPGFEERLSRPALLLVYAAFGVGLAAGAWANRRP
ncbi:hypothetical protein [Pseudoduganella sp.]|uniref:hypothetical protein n=1 Tax=Pseudoduganella sp. TaxID=1880898 RepID=UPI0035AE649A